MVKGMCGFGVTPATYYMNGLGHSPGPSFSLLTCKMVRKILCVKYQHSVWHIVRGEKEKRGEKGREEGRKRVPSLVEETVQLCDLVGLKSSRSCSLINVSCCKHKKN